MATYRCPECGAAHKEPHGQCRLCGAPLDTAVTVRTTAIDGSVAAERFEKRTIYHFIWIGLAVALVIIVFAFATGGIESSFLDRTWNRMPWVQDDLETEFAWPDPNERVIVDVPEVPVPVSESDLIGEVDLGADTSAWVTSVGDRIYVVAYTTGLDFEPPEDSEVADTQTLLSDTLDRLAEQQDGTVIRTGDPFGEQGGTGMDGLIDELSLPDGIGIGSVRLVESGGELYMVETIDYTADSDLHKDFRNSLVIVEANPDTTIPTIPDNARTSDDT
jgi:hypothetical protein